VDSPRRRGWQPRPQLRDAGGVLAAPVAVAGDVVLSGDGATADLTASADLASESAARMGGRAIALAGVVVVAGVVLSRVLGWLRTSVFLAEYGAENRHLDAFWNAFVVPDTLFQLVAAGAVGSALVPVASSLLANGEADRARRVVATVLNLMVLALVPMVVVIWLTTPAIVSIFAPTSYADQMADQIGLTRMMLLSPIFLAIGAVMTAGLNAIGKFGAPALAPNVYNIVIIVAAVALTPFFGIYALGIGVVVGAASQVTTQASGFGSNGLYAPVLDIHDPAVRETLRLMAPRALGLGVTQIVFFVNRYFAATLDTQGAITVYQSAFTLLQIPVGLIGVPLGIVLLPPLSRAIASKDDAQFRRLVDQSLRLLLFAVIAITGMMFALATPTIAFLYQHGSFTAADTKTMTPVFIVFLVGLVAHVLIALLAPIFYAGKDTRTPVTAALVAVAVDVGAAFALFPPFHLEGLALAIGLGAWAEVAVLVVLMERRIGFDLRPLLRRSIVFAGGAIVCSAATLIGYQAVERLTGGENTFLMRAVELAAGGLLGSAVYLAWAWALRLPELGDGVQLLRTLFRRTSRQT
jgi:putative peptidoglycan lipid II flippase